MKKLLLIMILLASLVSCSTENLSEEPTCDCKKTNNYYKYINGRWVIYDIRIEDIIENNCSLNGNTQNIFYDNIGGFRVKKEIITKCE